jgi:hypothetical protein
MSTAALMMSRGRQSSEFDRELDDFFLCKIPGSFASIVFVWLSLFIPAVLGIVYWVPTAAVLGTAELGFC